MFVFGQAGDITIYNHCTSNNKNYVDKLNYNVSEK